MSLYTSLNISPRKKRVHNDSDDEPTPKRCRIASRPPTCITHEPSLSLPKHLSRLEKLHSALQLALSHALATFGVTPSEQTAIIPNVLNHVSAASYSGFAAGFNEDDLRRLCWLWEWDPATAPLPFAAPATDEDPNPFLVATPPPPPKDWTRGSMGFIVSPTSHFSKPARKRVPVYGIGIQVETDIDKGITGGMAVTRWIAGADKRHAEFHSKLESFMNHQPDRTHIPDVPLADLPQIAVRTAQPSSLTRALASASPKGAAILENTVPSSPSKSSSESIAPRECPVPFRMTRTHPSEGSPSKSSASLLHTPSARRKRADALAELLTPRTPTRKRVDTGGSDSLPTTPVHQRGSDAQTAPSVPRTSRRQALYERIRLKSLASTPAKAKSAEVVGGMLTREQIQRLGREEIRRRCLLGRLGGIAETVWMLFSSLVGSTATPTARKRKPLPASEVVDAVVKSSLVPISALEASESLTMLTTLCPFFLKRLDISGEEWFEMPSTTSTLDTMENPEEILRDGESPTKLSGGTLAPPSSPGSTESPRKRRQETGGALGRVREIAKKELELCD